MHLIVACQRERGTGGCTLRMRDGKTIFEIIKSFAVAAVVVVVVTVVTVVIAVNLTCIQFN